MVGMTSTSAAAPRSPGRPRSSRADEAIVEAVLDLLAEGGAVDSLSIEAIAARAGVGKATIYRRWAGKKELLRDALRTLKGAPPAPAGDSVRDDLVILLRGVGRHYDPRAVKIMPCLVSEVNRSPEQRRIFEEMSEPRRRVMREVLERGIATGELRPDLDVEVTLLLLTGPMLMRQLLGRLPERDPDELAGQLVDAVLAGLRPR
ncbi:TetR/AcrR family transcriptional regulator [Micromonospora zhanjiangensis]|uniref:TetR/AcrR family transcriptional regulator n=1 Tax=Micromonospora zhanjiangensis TaxID=1522057 RepID=A0ABV8KJ79_9ACTN